MLEQFEKIENRPITPKEVAEYKVHSTPGFVFDAFNVLISANFVGGSAIVLTKNVVKEILLRSPGRLTENDIFEKGWLNIEEAYHAAGWKVTYDKPAFNEFYDAYFTFSPRKDR